MGRVHWNLRRECDVIYCECEESQRPIEAAREESIHPIRSFACCGEGKKTNNPIEQVIKRSLAWKCWFWGRACMRSIPACHESCRGYQRQLPHFHTGRYTVGNQTMTYGCSLLHFVRPEVRVSVHEGPVMSIMAQVRFDSHT